jgi:hypothetical protein
LLQGLGAAGVMVLAIEKNVTAAPSIAEQDSVPEIGQIFPFWSGQDLLNALQMQSIYLGP